MEEYISLKDRIRLESEHFLLGREFKLDVYADVHRAYIDPVSCKIEYYGTDTLKEKDGYLFHAAADYYKKIQDKTDVIFESEKERTLNVFGKTNLLSFLSFPDYMALDTNIFHFIYNDEKYKEAARLAGIYFSYQADLGGHVNAENIYTDTILTLDELPFQPDAMILYAGLLKQDYKLDGQELCGITWELLKRGHREYYSRLWKEKYERMLNAGPAEPAEPAENVLKRAVDTGNIRLSDTEAISALSYFVLSRRKEELLSFPDAAAETIFKENEFIKAKESNDFRDLVKV